MADANSRPIDAPSADDAFGEMVWDYAHDQLAERPRYRRDDGDVSAAHLDVYFSDPETWEASVRRTLATLDGPVLDVGCGAGKHAIYLQRRGLDVLGIDRSPGAIATARERGVDHAGVVDLRDVSMLGRSFGGVLAVGKQLGVGTSLAALRTTLDAMAAVARPGARLVADFDTPARRSEAYLADHRLREGVAVRRFRVEYAGLVGPWVDILLLEPSVLAAVVDETPWELIERVGPAADASDYLLVLERA